MHDPVARVSHLHAPSRFWHAPPTSPIQPSPQPRARAPTVVACRETSGGLRGCRLEASFGNRRLAGDAKTAQQAAIVIERIKETFGASIGVELLHDIDSVSSSSTFGVGLCLSNFF